MDDTTLAEIKPAINYEKSLKWHRLVYRPSAWLIFNSIFSYILYFLFMTGVFMISLFKPISGSHEPLWLVILGVLIIAWMLSNVFFKNALVKIEGKTIADDKINILSVMDEYFSSYDFVINNEQMMRSFKPANNPIWGRIITILFDGNDMYLNITTLGKTNMPTAIHDFSNYIRARRIAKYYREHYS